MQSWVKMAIIKPHEYDQLMLDAMNETYGLIVKTADPELLRQRLYSIRYNNKDLFAELSFVISPTAPETELWIVRNAGKTDKAQPEPV